MNKREKEIIIQYYKDSDNLQSAKAVLSNLLVDLSIKIHSNDKRKR